MPRLFMSQHQLLGELKMKYRNPPNECPTMVTLVAEYLDIACSTAARMLVAVLDDLSVMSKSHERGLSITLLVRWQNHYVLQLSLRFLGRVSSRVIQVRNQYPALILVKNLESCFQRAHTVKSASL